jgi:hypothetical protein
VLLSFLLSSVGLINGLVDRADSEFKSNEKKKEMMRKELASDGKPIPKKLEAIEDYKPKSRVEGAKRIEYFTIYIRKFMKARSKARNELGEEVIDRLRDSIARTNNKASEDERMEKEEAFVRRLKDNLKEYKAEEAIGYSMTAEMGGKVLLSLLTAKANYKPHIRAEIIARGIHKQPDFIKEWGDGIETVEDIVELEKPKDKKKKKVTFSILKGYVKVHECKLEVQNNTNLTMEEAMKKVKAITPFTELVRAVLAQQTNVMDELCLE